MPSTDEILDEFEKLREPFENQFILPWQTESSTAVPWGHAIMRVAMTLRGDLLTSVLKSLIQSESFALRSVAVHLIGAHSLDAMSDHLEERLREDVSVPVRALAASALTRLGSEHSASLLRIADDEHAEVKKVALAVFQQSPSPIATQCAIRWMTQQGEDESVRVASAAVLSASKQEEATTALIDQLSDNGSPDAVRGAAASALTESPSSAVSQALAAACSDSRHWVRAKSLVALALIDPIVATPIVESALSKHDPWMVRTHAVMALQHTHGEKTAIITELADDAEVSIRGEIAVLIGNLKSSDSSHLLLNLLQDPDLGVRVHACSSTETILGQSFGLEAIVGQTTMDMSSLTSTLEAAATALRAHIDAG